MALGNLVKQWETIMRDDDGVNGTVQVLSQLVWMLFLKVYDIKEDMWELYEDDFESALPEECRWRNWAKGKSQKEQMTGDELVNFVNNTLFPTLKDMGITAESSKRKVIVHEMMAESFNYMKDGVCIRKAINLLDKIEFDDQDERHEFNDIYETLLRGLESAGRSCEFYTPRALTQFITEKVNPRLGEVVADFACGTGGFLIDAVEHLKAQSTRSEDAETIEQTVFGVEKKQFPYMLCTTNMLLHDVDYPQVMHMNSLSKNVRDYSEKDKVDVVLMNPPYGGHEQDAVLLNFPAQLRSSETANLFIIEIMYRLKKNGRCGIILPDSFLQNDDSSLIEVKRKLFSEFNVHTIIRLPGSCFAPYTPIATNLIFFDKTQSTKETWFYRYDLIDDQKFSMKRNPITREKLSSIDIWWNNREEIKDKKKDESFTETWKSQCVSIDSIIESEYNLTYCSYPYEEKVILSPEETLSAYIKKREHLEKKLSSATSALESFLHGESSTQLIAIASYTKQLSEINSAFPSELRDSILQAAMQGKLSKRLSMDSSACALLAEIDIEKRELIANGKIKQEKPLPKISEDEIPFEIPSSWSWVRWGNLSNSIQYGYNAPAQPKGDIKMVRISDIQNNIVNWESVPFCSISDSDIETYRLSNNDLLFARTGGTVGKSYLVTNMTEDAVYAGYLIRSNYNKKLCPQFLKYFMESPLYWSQLQDKTIKTAQPNCNGKKLAKMILPFPPIEEQYRIVEQLDKLLPLCNA